MADSTMPAAAQETLKSFSEIDYEAEIISFFQELAQWPAKIIRANKEAFTNMTINRWVRLVVIVGGYMLVRPYIDKLFARMNGKDFQEEVTVDPKDKLAKAKMSANELRGRVQELGDSSDDEEETAKASGKDVEFGKKARKRQRQMLRKQLEAEEKARLEAEEELEDKELEEFLLRNSNWDGNPNPHALTLDD